MGAPGWTNLGNMSECGQTCGRNLPHHAAGDHATSFGKIGGHHVWIRTAWDVSDYLLDRLDYSESVMKNSCLEQMKPVAMQSCLGLDRLATWKELRCAMELSSEGAFELGCASDSFRDARSDFSGC